MPESTEETEMRGFALKLQGMNPGREFRYSESLVCYIGDDRKPAMLISRTILGQVVQLFDCPLDLSAIGKTAEDYLPLPSETLHA